MPTLTPTQETVVNALLSKMDSDIREFDPCVVYDALKGAVKKAIRTLPREVILDLAECFTPSCIEVKCNVATIPLPSDWCRFVSLSSTHWQNSITTLRRETLTSSNLGRGAYDWYKDYSAPIAHLEKAKTTCVPNCTTAISASPLPNTATVNDLVLYIVRDIAPENLPDHLKDLVSYMAIESLLIGTGEFDQAAAFKAKYETEISQLKLGIYGEEFQA